ncbi:MAG TPA: roadblock/LC7 domain-containing protein [Anaerolineales bacterium]|nr:roadblock/LC7 domain-containing protein [Anaerolineales bacterium]
MSTHTRTSALTLALQKFCQSTVGCRAAVLVSADGLVVASYPAITNTADDPTGGETVAAMASVLLRLGAQALERLQMGDEQRVLVQGANESIAVVPVNAETALALVLQADAKLGLALFRAQQIQNSLQKLL